MMKKQNKILSSLFIPTSVFIFSACVPISNTNSTLTDFTEVAQPVGDLSSSIDEMGGDNGAIAYVRPQDKFYKRSGLSTEGTYLAWLNPIQRAYAAACSATGTFGSCSNGGSSTSTIIRTFGGCTIGNATLEGTVDLSWNPGTGTVNNCQMATTGAFIEREPNYTVTGLRGANLAVTTTGVHGQEITWTSGTGNPGDPKIFSFTNDGIERKFTNASSVVIFDHTTETTSAITVTGSSRSSRVLSGGSLNVIDNLTGVTCTIVPTAVTWSSLTCNCPISGTWSGTCSDSNSYSLSLTGCGTGTLTYGTNTQSVTFDRCYSL